MRRALGGTHTGLAVLSVLVGEGELAKVSANHVEFDFNNVEGLAIVDCDVAAYHVGHYNSIPQVSLHWYWLLPGRRVLLGLLAFHVQTIVFVLDFAGEAAALPGPEELDYLLLSKFVELFRGVALEAILLQSLLLLLHGGHCGY